MKRNPRLVLSIFLVLGGLLLVNGQKSIFEQFDVKFSHEIEEGLENGKLRKSAASYYYTYIGEYKSALKTYELPLDWGLDTFGVEDSLDFLQFQPINAFNYLTEKTKEEQIVIISEAHQKPQHRVFTRKLLKDLYDNGFRYLGVETLTPAMGKSDKFLLDTLLNQRAYPLNNRLTGFYTREPQMGNMIREALALGFEVFAYEKTDRKKERDLEQARNIAKFIEKHPAGKIVIHCGWYHAIESRFPKRKKDNYMAYHIKKITGIDPLTIYQDVLSEKLLLKESPYYNKIKTNEISVLINDAGEIFNGKTDRTHFDLLIYHPKTKYIKGRPDWLFEIAGNKLVQVEKERVAKKQYPIIVKVFPIKETSDATPIDMIELTSSDEIKDLILQKGKYRIVLIDKDRKEYEYIKEVK